MSRSKAVKICRHSFTSTDRNATLPNALVFCLQCRMFISSILCSNMSMLWLYIKLVILRLRELSLQCIFNFLCAKVKMSEPWPSLPNMGPLAPGKPTGPIARSNRICLIKWIPNSTFRVPITNFRSWRTSTLCTDTCLNKSEKSSCKNVSSGNKSVCNLLIFRFSMRKDIKSLTKLKIYMNFICIK